MSQIKSNSFFSSLFARINQLHRKLLRRNRLQKPFKQLKKSPLSRESGDEYHKYAKTGAEIADNPQTADWWTRLYRGLVIDSSARHYRQMGMAVWLFLYFLLNANWKTGRLYRRLSTITEDTGISIYAVRRWLRVLVHNGYINAYYNGRFWIISVNKWRPLAALFSRRRKTVGSKIMLSQKAKRVVR